MLSCDIINVEVLWWEMHNLAWWEIRNITDEQICDMSIFTPRKKKQHCNTLTMFTKLLQPVSRKLQNICKLFSFGWV